MSVTELQSGECGSLAVESCGPQTDPRCIGVGAGTVVPQGAKQGVGA